MYTKNDIINGIEKIGIKNTDTLLVHSSMKSIGEAENGADTVLDAFIEYLSQDGLLIFPTHTWSKINAEYNIYNPKTEPSCVGILSNLFMKRENVIRSLHPTHSVAAIGKDSYEYIKGEEFYNTPCSRKGCWGKLYDRKAKILFLGCSLKSNTYLHGTEEWNNIPNRLTDECENLKIIMPDGSIFDRPLYRHHSPIGDISRNYDKMQPVFLANKIAVEGYIGDAKSVLCDCVGMADITGKYLTQNPNLFIDDTNF